MTETHALSTQELPAAGAATHELRLTLYMFRGTRWAAPEILAAALEASRLLAQCGVALAGAELQVLETPERFHFYSTAVARELLRTIAVPKPAVFFVEDTHAEPAYDAEAIGLGNARTRPELANTIWFAYGARDLPHALAHELVHVLSDSGEHSDEAGNLMGATTSPQRTHLSGAQCERLRENGAAHRLLTRRTQPATGNP